MTVLAVATAATVVVAGAAAAVVLRDDPDERVKMAAVEACVRAQGTFKVDLDDLREPARVSFGERRGSQGEGWRVLLLLSPGGSIQCFVKEKDGRMRVDSTYRD